MMNLTGLKTKKALTTMDFWETIILLWWLFFNKRKQIIWTQAVIDGMSGVSAFYKAYKSDQEEGK